MIRLPKPTYDVITSFIALEEFVREFTGYTFVNRHLLLVAIYGNSYPEHPRQRLAILGDGIVKYAACADWYEYGGATSRAGEFVNWAVSNLHLSVVALENGLAKYVRQPDLEPSETYKGATERNLGTIMEALLGAIHEDCGQDSRVVRSAMSRMGLKVSPENWRLRQDEVLEIWTEHVLRPRRGTARYDAEHPHVALNQNAEDFQEETQEETQKKTPEATPKYSKKSRSTLRREAKALKLLGMRTKRFAGSRSLSLENHEGPIPSMFGKGNLDESADNEENSEDGLTFGKGNLEEWADDDEDFEDVINSHYLIEGESLPVASDGSLMEPELPKLQTQDSVWRQHGWVAQHCQITLEVAQSKRVIRRKESSNTSAEQCLSR